MRIALIATVASLALLGACKGSDAGQGNNASANIATNATTSTVATGSSVVPQLATQPVGKDQAAALMHERHEGMETIGKANKAISRELEGSSPNLKVIQDSAGKIASLAPKVPGWFPPGTGTEVGKTRAKAEIWQKPQDFAVKAHDLATAAAALQAAAGEGDLAKIKGAFDQLGKSCKACHDSYRAPEH